MLSFPSAIASEEELEQVLTQPGPHLVEFIRSVSSPLLIFGAGGKMGPTLAVMARRAAEFAGHPLEIIAISRFSDPPTRKWLDGHGIKTHACDLLEKDALQALPETDNLIYLAGFKFGTARNPSATWAMNTIVPANVTTRYPRARTVALSTGNVYAMTDVTRGGADESHPLTPLGEYANAAVARERILQFYAQRHGTPLCLLRLFYAVELRYGIVSELARGVISGQPIDVSTGSFNCIWQRDANEMILRSLALASAPPAIYNLCQAEAFSVRTIAAELGERLGAAPIFHGVEESTALLGDSRRIIDLLGHPPTPMGKVLDWTAGWVRSGGRDLGKPTRFAVRDGVY